jgi:hypothetical protein
MKESESELLCADSTSLVVTPCSRENPSNFSVVFVSPTANAELVPKFSSSSVFLHAGLQTSHQNSTRCCPPVINTLVPQCVSLAAFSKRSTSHHVTSTSQRFILPPTHEHEWMIPANFQRRIFFGFPLTNVFYLSTDPKYFNTTP